MKNTTTTLVAMIQNSMTPDHHTHRGHTHNTPILPYVVLLLHMLTIYNTYIIIIHILEADRSKERNKTKRNGSMRSCLLASSTYRTVERLVAMEYVHYVQYRTVPYGTLVGWPKLSG